MTPWRRFLLAGAIVLLATPAFAGMDLVAPRAGERLEGGSQAMLTWTGESLPTAVEEWEAFLSVDGGGYYAVRVTPHLDVNIRSVTWRVPNVASTRARLMLRIGDETHERIIALPQTFTIESSSAPTESVSVETETAPGEAATPDGEPTVEWVSSDFVTHRCANPAASADPRIAPSYFLEANVTQAPATRVASRASNEEKLVHVRRQHMHATIVSRPIFLLTTRLNV